MKIMNALLEQIVGEQASLSAAPRDAATSTAGIQTQTANYGSAEHWPVEKLRPHPRNASLYHNSGPDDALIASDREHGVLEAIVVSRRTGEIISGHRRWRARPSSPGLDRCGHCPDPRLRLSRRP